MRTRRLTPPNEPVLPARVTGPMPLGDAQDPPLDDLALAAAREIGDLCTLQPGAVKEGKLSINVGSQVIAKAVQRAVDAAPAKALEAVGGQAGLAEIVFRKLNLEDGANERNTLAPVIAALPATLR